MHVNFLRVADESERQFNEEMIHYGDIPSERSNEAVSFVNVSIEAGLSGIKGDNLAWGDYNNDDHIDLLVRGNATCGTMLFENQGPPHYNFVDVTTEVGIDCRGYGIWGDYDNDGNLDFFCADFGDTLWHNEGEPDYHFSNATSEEMYFKDGAPSEAAAWLDYDNDGFLDIFCTCWTKQNYTQYGWPNYGMPDHLWHNNGDGTFSDVTVQAGIYRNNPAHAAMSIAVCDYNDDGWQDVYVGNYHLCPNHLWENQGDGTFINAAGPERADVDGDADYYDNSGPYYGHSAGCAWGDFDNDLDMDLWVSNLAHKDDERSGMNRGAFCDDAQLLDSSGSPNYHFNDVRGEVGIPITPSGTVIYDPNDDNYKWKDEDYFGCTWGDYDNDGDLDIWIPQVKTYSFWDWCYLWRNNGDRSFTDQAESLGIRVWSNTGAAWGDYDNDGDLDLVTEGTYPYRGVRELHLFRNQGNSNHWVEIDLKGTTANSMAIGSRIILEAGGEKMSRIVGGDAGGHGFQNSPIVHFGLGGVEFADRITIRWPDQGVTELFNVPVDQRIGVVQGEGASIVSLSVSPADPCEDEEITLVLSTDAPLQTGGYKVEWDLDGDGDYEYDSIPTTGGEVISPAISFPEKGTYNFSVILYDLATHLGEGRDMNVTVINLPPVTEAGWDILAAEDTVVLFDASGTVDTPSDMMAGLEYRWDFGDGASTEWQDTPHASNTYPEKGNYSVTLVVKDDDDEKGSDTLLVTVYNVPPRATAPATLIGEEDSLVLFTGSGEDTFNDTDGLSFSWDFGDGNSSFWYPHTTAGHIYERSDNYTAHLIVRDLDGGRGIANVSVNITNPYPTVKVKADKDKVGEDLPVEFELRGEDTESDIPHLRYSMDYGDGNRANWSTDTNWKHSFETGGDKIVTAWVMDDDGALGNRSIYIKVLNSPPSATFKIVYNGSEVLEDSAFTLDASGSTDSASDILSLNYTWQFSDGQIFYERKVNATFSIPGVNTITLIVRDDDSFTAKASRTMITENIEPVADFTYLPKEIKREEKILFNATNTKLAPSDEDAEFEWDFGDGTSGEGSISSHCYLRSGEYIVTLTVDDGEEGVSTKKKKIKVLEDETDKPTPAFSGKALGLGGVVIVLILVGAIFIAIMIKRKKKMADEAELITGREFTDEFGRVGDGETRTIKTSPVPEEFAPLTDLPKLPEISGIAVSTGSPWVQITPPRRKMVTKVRKVKKNKELPPDGLA